MSTNKTMPGPYEAETTERKEAKRNQHERTNKQTWESSHIKEDKRVDNDKAKKQIRIKDNPTRRTKEDHKQTLHGQGTRRLPVKTNKQGATRKRTFRGRGTRKMETHQTRNRRPDNARENG